MHINKQYNMNSKSNSPAKTIRNYLLLSIFFIGLTSCATSPEGRQQFKLLPEAQINAMGVQSFEQIKQQTPLSKDENINQYVQCIANKIIPHVTQNPDITKWEVQVFDDDQANAFALPGYKIGVYTGLLKYAKNQHQLAAVIGHEIAHVIANHGNERVSTQLATQAGMSVASVILGSTQESSNNALILAGLGLSVQYGVTLPFSRSHESEADLIGLDLMAKAGFTPGESVTLWQNMSQNGASTPEFMSTHPSSETRIRQLKERIPQANITYQHAVSQGQRAMCEM